MNSDDLPTRDANRHLQELSVEAFRTSIAAEELFVVQGGDEHDFGSDLQIEAIGPSGGMTNFRVHVQVKGTSKQPNADGSVSVAVRRSNLNYLNAHPHSQYVLYHVPSKRLLVASADDVRRDARHSTVDAKTITVRTRTALDREYQRKLHQIVMARSTLRHGDRLCWLESPPDDVARLVLRTVPSIEVPDSAEDALLTLTTLLRQGQDEVISKAFSQFEASIGPEDRRLIPALLAEINLGMTHRPVNADRVRRGIRMLQKYCPRDDLSAVYNIANGYAVIGEIQNARAMYTKVIRAKPEVSKDLLAQAWKNLGSLLEQDGDHQGARDCYARAVTLCPQLVEASMALAMAERDMGNLEKSLEYFGQVLTGNCPSEIALSTRGHRIEVLFRIGRFREAFEDIWVLIPDAGKHTWILPWCARLVRANAESLGDMLPSALQFWDTCALRWPEDPLILEARLLCIGYAQMRGVSVPVDFQTYRDQVYAAIELELDIDESYLLDRVGHWAQADGDWDEASEHFRKAWEIEPERYGHCYGTSLNYLERFEEAHAVHRVQVESELATDQSWFQLAIASEGIGAIDECIMAYKMAIEVNPECSLAWFNLGGVVWNSGDKIEATEIWKKAISRFPKDTLVSKVREFCPTLSTFDNGE